MELLRVARQWRDLINRKRFGFGHGIVEEKEGSLALFCPACPQPGINLEDNWQEIYPEYVLILKTERQTLIENFRWLMKRIIVADGNFKGELVKPRNPDKGVSLTSGEAYVIEKKRYSDHLKEGKEWKPVSFFSSDQVIKLNYNY